MDGRNEDGPRSSPATHKSSFPDSSAFICVYLRTIYCLNHSQRSLSVESPKSTSIIVMIQKRTTTWFSFQPFNS